MSTVAILALGALYGRVNDRQFRALVLWLLLASGIVLMVSNLTLAR